MSPRISKIILFSIVLATFIGAVIVYPSLPEEIASHWNIAGEVDDYLSKFWGVFLLPLLMLVLAGVSVVLPRLDPTKNIQSFRVAYDACWIVIELFLAYLFAFTIAWNLGYQFHIGQALAPAFAVFWYAMGIVMARTKRNWFVGIRTPWTLSSDTVWDKTHELGSTLFKLAGVVALLGFFFPSIAFYLVVIPVLVLVLLTVPYSYVAFREEEKKKTT